MSEISEMFMREKSLNYHLHIINMSYICETSNNNILN